MSFRSERRLLILLLLTILRAERSLAFRVWRIWAADGLSNSPGREALIRELKESCLFPRLFSFFLIILLKSSLISRSTLFGWTFGGSGASSLNLSWDSLLSCFSYFLNSVFNSLVVFLTDPSLDSLALLLLDPFELTLLYRLRILWGLINLTLLLFEPLELTSSSFFFFY